MRNYRHWKTSDIRRVKNYRQVGMSLQEISNRLGRSVSSVKSFISQCEDIPSNRAGRKNRPVVNYTIAIEEVA